jgi:hypothetical protein
MKSPTPNNQGGFSVAEMLIATSMASVLFAAILTTTISLQKSFRAADSYFATHMQQVRIIDYLTRDVKRGLDVKTSFEKQSVTVTLPNYIIKEGDAEAVANPALIGSPRTPTIQRTAAGPQVNYGTTTSTVVYNVNGISILRTENGAVTTIASSTDQLIAKTTVYELELTNTQYTKTAVTFLPLFSSGENTYSRSGTTVCATSYLRNRRRA